MKSAPNLLNNMFSLCKSARRRRGAAYFDLATELRVRIVTCAIFIVIWAPDIKPLKVVSGLLGHPF
jgi:hypothetical protein